MGLWRIIMMTALAITGLAIFYLSYRLGRFSFLKNNPKKLRFFGGAFFVVLAFGLLVLLLNAVNAVICVIYLTLISLLCDFILWLYQKLCRKKLKHDWAFPVAVLLTFLALSLGWYNAHHVWQTDYKIQTDKNIHNIKKTDGQKF